MKFCLSSRQEHEYLAKAEEIKVAWRDRNIIYDFSQKYPNATFVLTLPRDEELDWKEIERYRVVTQDRLILAATSREQLDHLKNSGVYKFFLNFAIGSFYELNTLKEYGVCYVRLAPPIFFQISKIQEIGIPVRLIPNVAHDGFLPNDPVYGMWIRPEDLHLYEPCATAIEFDDANLAKERTLYRIYAEQKTWPGNLNMLISNFPIEALNRKIPSNLTEKRLNCGQRCQNGGSCRLCYLAIKLARSALTS